MNMSDNNNNNKILWSCVARSNNNNNTVLAEAALDYSDAVFQTATELLAKKPTPGFEYHTQRKAKMNRRLSWKEQQQRHRLKGIKFHVYEHDDDDDDDDDEGSSQEYGIMRSVQNKSSLSKKSPKHNNLRIWVFAAVYDPSYISQHDVQSFLEKIVTISENFRDDWKDTETLGLQASFAPILKQRMEEVTYYGKMAILEQQVQACQAVMEDNIEIILQNQDRIQDLDDTATHLRDMTSIFKKRTRKLRRAQMMKNAKHGIILGTVVTAATAAIVIPPLVAIL